MDDSMFLFQHIGAPLDELENLGITGVMDDYKEYYLLDYCYDYRLEIPDFNNIKINSLFDLAIAINKGALAFAKHQTELSYFHIEFEEVEYGQLSEADKSFLFSKVLFKDIDLCKYSYYLFVFCILIYVNYDDVSKTLSDRYDEDSLIHIGFFQVPKEIYAIYILRLKNTLKNITRFADIEEFDYFRTLNTIKSFKKSKLSRMKLSFFLDNNLTELYFLSKAAYAFARAIDDGAFNDISNTEIGIFFTEYWEDYDDDSINSEDSK